MSKFDQKYIPWSAGGCIATNAFCGIANTLFDNNEAQRGTYPITLRDTAAEYIPDADARQGFGGVLSVGAEASLRMVNCQFMKNKAVGYSSVYNFKPNNMYSDPDSMQLAFNTIFWGNEVFELKNDKLSDLPHDEDVPAASEEAFKRKYFKSRAGVFHYDGELWEKYDSTFLEYDRKYKAYENPFDEDVTNTLRELRELGDSLEGMFFCSYRLTYGPRGMKPTHEGYLLMSADERSAFTDPRMKNVPNGGRFHNLFTYLYGNNNTLINRINTAADGPNFRQPTFVAGIDGYMQNADWLQSRMNLTTDQGWGYLKQETYRDTSYYLTRYTDKTQYDSRPEALAAANAALGTDTCTAWSVLPVLGFMAAKFDTTANKSVYALYNFYSKQFSAYTGESHPPMPLGDQYYMTYTTTTSSTETTGKMERISRNPRPGVEAAFVDLGIYEYQNVQLDIDGQEIDTIWVATRERGSEHDGTSWEKPTVDLQWAIDMLMSSHNGHDKYICLMGDEDGSYTPNTVMDNRLAFVISSNSLAPLLPDSAMAGENYSVASLNFLGGYSYDDKDAKRDPTVYPTVIAMPDDGNKNHLNQLFVVEDMTRQLVQANWMGFASARDSVVIPITFDGITFINPYSVMDSTKALMNENGGAAIYYRWQRQYENGGPNMNMALHPDSALIDGQKMTLPKLTLSNCIFMDNGDTAANYINRSPAVRIDHGGGSSLVVNSLFHSNAGSPIYAQSEDIGDLSRAPNDVVIVNSTFALNGGHLSLESDSSEVHNSLIWLDDLKNDTTVQLAIGKKTSLKQWGKLAGDKDRKGTKGKVTHNAIWSSFQDGTDTLYN